MAMVRGSHLWPNLLQNPLRLCRALFQRDHRGTVGKLQPGRPAQRAQIFLIVFFAFGPLSVLGERQWTAYGSLGFFWMLLEPIGEGIIGAAFGPSCALMYFQVLLWFVLRTEALGRTPLRLPSNPPRMSSPCKLSSFS